PMRPAPASRRRLVQRLPPVVQRRDYALLLVAMSASSLGGQMAAVAVGWQVYAIHRSALDLGLIGLAEFVPLPLLALPAGHLADRLPRTVITAASDFAVAIVVVLLLVVTLAGAHQLWAFFALAGLT